MERQKLDTSERYKNLKQLILSIDDVLSTYTRREVWMERFTTLEEWQQADEYVKRLEKEQVKWINQAKRFIQDGVQGDPATIVKDTNHGVWIPETQVGRMEQHAMDQEPDAWNAILEIPAASDLADEVRLKLAKLESSLSIAQEVLTYMCRMEDELAFDEDDELCEAELASSTSFSSEISDKEIDARVAAMLNQEQEPVRRQIEQQLLNISQQHEADKRQRRRK